MPPRRSYTAAEKLSIVKYAESHGNREASRHFSVNEANVRLWRKSKETLQIMPGKKKAKRGLPPRFPELEKTLMEWIVNKRQQGIGISCYEIRLKALEFKKSFANAIEFKASYGWAVCFMKRHGLSVRIRTTIAQRLPDDHEDKLLRFQKFVLKLRKEHMYDLSQIGNADQTPLTFDMPYNRTVDVKGKKTVSIRTTGHEKSHFTVMLACTADGGKLPPYIVFKRKTLPKLQFPKGVHIRVHEKGWMDEALTVDWLKCVWRHRPGGARKPPSMLVLDSFRCHRMPSIQKEMRQIKSDLVIIPGGMTRLLQPLDVSVNKPMKEAIRHKWNAWLSDGNHTYTAGGRMRQPTLLDVAEWVLSTWNELDPSIIKQGFLKCCISNNLDGSEDDILWEDVQVSSDEDDDGDIYYDGTNNYDLDATTID